MFVWIILGFNAVFIGFYFSGIYSLQQLIAPTIDVLQPHQWREFGLPEIFQHILLIASVFVLARTALSRTDWSEKILLLIGAALFIVLLLEELDYGLHYYQFITGDTSGINSLNWHNKHTEGVENATILKRINDLGIIIWFILIPLLSLIKPIGRLLSRIPLIPSFWYLAGFIVALICSKFAHYLDDAGHALINGVPGNLSQSIAEFRETSVYYLYFLYILDVARTKPLLWRQNAQKTSS